MKMTVAEWERARAELAAQRMRAVNDFGIAGAEDLERSLPEGVSYPSEGDPAVRRLAYALFGSLVEAAPWSPANLENSFTALGGAAPPGCVIDSLGNVSLRGAVVRGSAALNTTIFTLPANMRPPYLRRFVQPCASGVAHVDVLTSGFVQVSYASATLWFTSLHFDGISFDLRG